MTVNGRQPDRAGNVDVESKVAEELHGKVIRIDSYDNVKAVVKIIAEALGMQVGAGEGWTGNPYVELGAFATKDVIDVNDLTEALKLQLKGDRGEKGDTGEQGIQGVHGEQGERGETGERGEKGDKGDKGDDGPKGDSGDPLTVTRTQETSAPGGYNVVTLSDGTQLNIRNGLNGERGATGPQGETGPKGDKGDTGEKGDKGDKGDKGERGIQGETGADGKSAYALAVDGGYFPGTLAEWLASLKGETGDSVSVTRVVETLAPGELNVVEFSDGSRLSVRNGQDGAPGASITITSFSQSTESGGASVVVFSDGTVLRVYNGTDDADFQSRLTTLLAMVQEGTSPQNPIVNVNTVADMIEENSAHYITDDGEPFSSLEDLEAYEGPLTHNDFAYVKTTESEEEGGDTVYTKYRYDVVDGVGSWSEMYSRKYTDFTEGQRKALDSGITAEKVGKLDAVEEGAEVNIIEKVKHNGVAKQVDGTDRSVDISTALYGTCDTASGTAAKVVTLSGGTALASLYDGARVYVRFANSNTAASPTLKVGGTDAKSIVRYGSTAAFPASGNAPAWHASEVVGFVYDGTRWQMLKPAGASTSYPGVVQLDSSVSSTATDKAATPNAVKTAYDKASGAQDRADSADERALKDLLRSYVLWTEPSVGADDVGAAGTTPEESYLYFRPSAFGASSACVLRALVMHTSTSTLPTYTTGKLVAELYTSGGALLDTSLPFGPVDQMDHEYTVFFEGFPELDRSSTYKVAFFDYSTGNRTTFPLRTSAVLSDDQDIYFANNPKNRPIMKALFSDAEASPKSLYDKMDKVPGASSGHLASFGSNGVVQDSGATIGVGPDQVPYITITS